MNTGLGQRAAALAGDEHVGAGRALRVGQHAVLLHDERAPERHHHQDAQDAAGEGEHRDLEVVEVARAALAEEDQRGTVKTTPAATDSPADPMVWTMLFSRIVEPPSRFSTEIASTAIGMEALTVRPARRPR